MHQFLTDRTLIASLHAQEHWTNNNNETCNYWQAHDGVGISPCVRYSRARMAAVRRSSSATSNSVWRYTTCFLLPASSRHDHFVWPVVQRFAWLNICHYWFQIWWSVMTADHILHTRPFRLTCVIKVCLIENMPLSTLFRL